MVSLSNVSTSLVSLWLLVNRLLFFICWGTQFPDDEFLNTGPTQITYLVLISHELRQQCHVAVCVAIFKKLQSFT